MTTFDKREDSFERKSVHDAELQFKAEARRNKMLGLWAAERMGRTGDEATAYARDLVTADIAAEGDEDVFQKVRADLAAAGAPVTDDQIRLRMQEFLTAAMAEIQSSRS